MGALLRAHFADNQICGFLSPGAIDESVETGPCFVECLSGIQLRDPIERHIPPPVRGHVEKPHDGEGTGDEGDGSGPPPGDIWTKM